MRILRVLTSAECLSAACVRASQQRRREESRRKEEKREERAGEKSEKKITTGAKIYRSMFNHVQSLDVMLFINNTKILLPSPLSSLSFLFLLPLLPFLWLEKKTTTEETYIYI